MSVDGRSSAASTPSFEMLESSDIPREFLEMKWKITLLEKEIQDLRENPAHNFESIKKALSGQWRIKSSSDMHEFINRNELSDFEAIKFQLADYCIDFPDNNTISTCYKVGGKVYDEKSIELSKPYFYEDCGRMTYISGDSIKTILVSGSTVEEVKRLSISGGSLHFKKSRKGSDCTRIYCKVGNGIMETADVKSSKQEIQELKSENELLKEEIKKLSKDNEKAVKVMKFENDVLKNKLEHVSEDYQALQLTDSEVVKEVENLREFKNSVKIEQLITGQWRDVNPTTKTVSIKLESGKIWVRENGETQYTQKSFWKVVDALKYQDSNYYEIECSFNNGKLICKKYYKGNWNESTAFERVGDPL